MTRLTVEPAVNGMVQPDGSVLAVMSGFPLQLVHATGVFEEVKALVVRTPGDVEDYALFVWDKGSGTGPYLRLARWVDQIESMGSQVAKLVTADESNVQLSPSRFCGCGSRLRSFKPWGNSRVIGAAKPQLPWKYAAVTVS